MTDTIQSAEQSDSFRDCGTELYRNCEVDPKAAVLALLRLGADIDQPNDRGETPLMLASATCMKIALLLLKKGADPHKVDHKGNSVLHHACHSGNPKIVAALIERGVDSDHQNAKGETPLMTASYNTQISLLLLKKGADPTKVDHRGNTALHHCAGYSAFLSAPHQKLVTALIKSGLDINQPNAKGETPLIVAIRSHDSAPQAQDLFGFKPITECDPLSNCGTELHRACLVNDKATVLRLLGQGVDIDQLNDRGETPLMLASSLYKRIALLLLKHGADPNRVDHQGNSVLHHALRSGNRKIVAALIERGVDIDHQNAQGETPLLIIVSFNTPIALVLLKKGADPKKRDNQGNTALHNCSGFSEISSAARQKLVVAKSGLDADQQNAKDDLSPIIAISARSRGPQSRYLFETSLLEQGADCNRVDADERSALHHAAKRGNDELVRTLVDRGASINQQDSAGMTPLMAAASSFAAETTAIYLLERGADPTKVDQEGRTALDHATTSRRSVLIKRLEEYNHRPHG